MQILNDLRFAVRSFARTPGVAALALLTLAVGVGANAAIFSVIHSVLVAPVPYPHPERVVVPWRFNAQMGVSVSPSHEDITRWASLDIVESTTTYIGGEMVLTGRGEPQAMQVTRVAPGLFDFVGAQPALGRRISADEAAGDAAARVVLLSDQTWRTLYGARHDVLGERIELGDASYEVIGVLPPDFYLPLNRIDMVAPLASAPAAGSRPDMVPAVLMRLRPGVPLAEAEARFTAAGVDAVGHGPGWSVRLMRPMDIAGDAFRRALYVLLGAVAFVLLIACANVANIILARNAARQREIAVRVALGAGRWRLVRQLLTENLLLAAAGGALGLAFEVWGVQAIVALRPPDLRELENVRVRPVVFAFGFGVSLLTGLLFGLLPAVAATRVGVSDALKQGARSAGGGRARLARRALSVAEVALALVLLVGAGLLIRSYERLQRADLGFNPERLLALRVTLPEARYPTPASRAEFVSELTARLKAVPGVRHAVAASGLPPRGGLLFGQFEVEGRPPAEPPAAAPLGGGWVHPGFFEAMGIPILDGRSFADADLRSGEVAIINESLARQHWADESPVGRRVRLNPKSPWVTVVGVAGDVKSQWNQTVMAQVYQPMTSQWSFPAVNMVIATTADPMALAAAVKGQVWSLDPKLPLGDLQTVEHRMAATLARPRFNAVLLSVFAGIGLLLAAIGVYGVISYSVGIRRREIGVRMALGAQARDIRRSVLGEAGVLAAIGVAIGSAGALALARLLGSLLHEVSAADPLTFGVVAAGLMATALLAAWVPARRAMTVDPVVALRLD